MTCSDFEKKVYLYLSGELDPSEKNDFKNHLKKCIVCEKEIEALKARIAVLEAALDIAKEYSTVWLYAWQERFGKALKEV
ncbi:zf-HC2 domain-containing protein, partial [bacterium]|nr:zf-HC2 domain-containing protein [bacterium]